MACVVNLCALLGLPLAWRPRFRRFLPFDRFHRRRLVWARVALAAETSEILPNGFEQRAFQRSKQLIIYSPGCLATVLFLRGQAETAMEHLIQIVKRDREWEDDKARRQLVKFFEALGPKDPATLKGRRMLSTVLFR